MVPVFNCRNVLVGQRREPSVWTEEAQEGSIEYEFPVDLEVSAACLLYTSDAADE